MRISQLFSLNELNELIVSINCPFDFPSKKKKRMIVSIIIQFNTAEYSIKLSQKDIFPVQQLREWEIQTGMEKVSITADLRERNYEETEFVI